MREWSVEQSRECRPRSKYQLPKLTSLLYIYIYGPFCSWIDSKRQHGELWKLVSANEYITSFHLQVTIGSLVMSPKRKRPSTQNLGTVSAKCDNFEPLTAIIL